MKLPATIVAAVPIERAGPGAADAIVRNREQKRGNGNHKSNHTGAVFSKSGPSGEHACRKSLTHAGNSNEKSNDLQQDHSEKACYCRIPECHPKTE
ncbi:hypothetical protein [uncultured Brevibacillus sp.]|uniref:hypothetical protein n=1 Tax=uncultured Brevibacillus sp. TaxID=169970 RepID=UPI0025961649|nr:hypothetical protein [uncultured Brevibacillus sp.]